MSNVISVQNPTEIKILAFVCCQSQQRFWSFGPIFYVFNLRPGAFAYCAGCDRSEHFSRVSESDRVWTSGFKRGVFTTANGKLLIDWVQSSERNDS